MDIQGVIESVENDLKSRKLDVEMALKFLDLSVSDIIESQTFSFEATYMFKDNEDGKYTKLFLFELFQELNNRQVIEFDFITKNSGVKLADAIDKQNRLLTKLDVALNNEVQMFLNNFAS